MKLARSILKIVGGGLALAGAVCLVIGFWDVLADRPCCRKRVRPSEYDDYADVE